MVCPHVYEGYRGGVELTRQHWDSGGQEIGELLAPGLSFTGSTNWRAHDLDDTAREKMRRAITPNVQKIHAFWLERRAEFAPATEPVRRSEPRAGRNDPCPCGSGKKYKKCCLH